MRYLRLMRSFIQVSIQEEMAYRANFFISVLNSLLSLGTGILAIIVLFSQVSAIHGWTFAATLALLGTYLLLSALRQMVIGTSFERLAGLDGEIWTGRFDFTLLRPLPVQFLASFRYWNLLSAIDLLLGAGVLCIAVARLHQALTLWQVLSFLLALCIAILLLYAILLIFVSLVFWSAGFLFTWVFDGLFQLARYPLGLYPGWAQLILTWIIPIGIMTTIPAQALTGTLPPLALPAFLVFAVLLVIGASVLFKFGLRRYASASS
jgi:ABC-2 type transport system permease protein